MHQHMLNKQWLVIIKQTNKTNYTLFCSCFILFTYICIYTHVYVFFFSVAQQHFLPCCRCWAPWLWKVSLDAKDPVRTSKASCGIWIIISGIRYQRTDYKLIGCVLFLCSCGSGEDISEIIKSKRVCSCSHPQQHCHDESTHVAMAPACEEPILMARTDFPSRSSSQVTKA